MKLINICKVDCFANSIKDKIFHLVNQLFIQLFLKQFSNFVYVFASDFLFAYRVKAHITNFNTMFCILLWD